ncbi:DUF3037 domain-containing protein [bacterium]|nr:DUF3037 domain-containing protein [bacterium]
MTERTNQTTMRHRGFYSLVQYCPDLSRLEVANVGVVLFCAELNYLGVELTQNHTRISQMFGRGQRDLKRLRAVKAGLEERLTSAGEDLKSLDRLNNLAALHVNTIRMTRFMPCRVSGTPQVDLQRIFEELVELPKHRKPVSKFEALKKTLDDRFSAPEVSRRLRRDLKVRIPILDREEEIPYGYQNGRLNLIAPVVFPKKQAALEDRAAKYAVEGKFLYDNPDSQLGEMQMLVVGDFSPGSEDSVNVAERILESHQVRLFPRRKLSELTKEIRRHGHVVPS